MGLFITHPEVVVDPATPVTCWSLSEQGQARMRTFAAASVVDSVTAIWSSAERKAKEAAELLGGRLALPIQVLESLGENDRSATGFLPPEEFETVADAFFESPAKSVRGWETAAAAQLRIRGAVAGIAAGHVEGDLAILSHGAVGALLLCSCLGAPISRAHDQPSQGHFFSFDPQSFEVLHLWRPLEAA